MERRILPAAVFVLAFLFLSPVVGADFLNWDDDWLLTSNPHWRGLSPSHLEWMFSNVKGIYSPLGWMSHAVDHALWRMNPAGHHLTNLLLHATNALLVYLLILALVGGADERRKRWAAAAGALFFAIHPLRVEPVAWVTERWDLLATTFYVLTVLVYLRTVREENPDRRRRWYFAALGCALLASLSKGWAMTLPVTLLALDAWPLKRLSRKTLIEKVPFAILAVATAIVAVVAQKEAGAMAGLAEHPPLQRAAQAVYGLCFYVWKTLVPLSLSPMYAFETGFSPGEPRFLLCGALVIGLTAILVVYRRRWPALLLAWACYAVAVSPVLGIAQSGPHFVADRYTYLASIPFAILVAAGLTRLSPRALVPACGAAGVVLLVLSGLAFVQTRVWKDSVSVWNRAIELDGKDYFAYFNRGHARYVAGDIEGALADYEMCRRLNPPYLARAEATAKKLDYQGRVWHEKGGAEEALASFGESLRLNPLAAETYFHRSLLLQDLGNLVGAVADLSRAIHADPIHVQAFSNRGDARRRLGDWRGALADFDEAIRLDAKEPFAYANRALVHRQRGDQAGAIRDLEKALEVAPKDWPYRASVEQDLNAARGNPTPSSTR